MSGGRLKPLAALRGAQADASHPQRQIWLSASAGTGKTHVLTARVLRLLLSGAAPETILCLTFTKAGAAEMGARIQQRLASWVRKKDVALSRELFALGERHDEAAVAAARRLFARVLDAPGGGLRIQTIHAFAQALLAGFPAEAGLGAGFRPLDGREEAALARATLGRMVADAEAGGDHGLIRDVQLLSRRLGEGGAESHLVRCGRHPAGFAALGSREGIEARVRHALDVWLGDIEARIVEECDGFDCAGIARMAEANRAWGTKTGLAAAALIEAFVDGDARARAALLEDVLKLVQTKEGSLKKLSAKLIDCDPGHEEDCRDLAEVVGMLLGQRRRGELAALLAAGLRAGHAFAAAYAAAKQRDGVVDFDDLIRLTVDLLGRPGIGAWIRYKLDRRTDHVLVDEGQDTNARQWAIVRALTGEFFTEDPKTSAVRTIFSVGDFKQAIFGFQGTDPAAFAAARQRYDEELTASRRSLDWLSLDRSFRSTPPILAVVDRLIAEVGPSEMGLFDDPEPHVSARAHLPGTVALWAPLSVETAEGVDDGEEGWLDDAQRLFATKLAEQVRDWLRAGLWLPGKGRALRPEDVLILVRRRGDLASLIVARLHAEGVAVAGVDRLRLGAPLAVRDLMAAIRFALQPHDDLALACLLVSPLIGFDQDELYAVAHKRRGSLWRALLASETHGPVADALRGLLARADFTTPYVFLETILSGAMQGRRRLLERLGQEALDPIEELLNAALTFEREATPTLQRFLDWFDRGEVEVTRDPSAPLDAVRVMTVHGAKGLQAPLVVLADATGDPAMQPKRGLDWAIDEAGEYALPVIRPRKDESGGTLAEAMEAIERREREEHWRLLYVAATRAEEHLVIGGALGPRAKGVAPEGSWHAKLDRTLEALGAEMVDDPVWGGARHFYGDRAPVAEVRPARVAKPARERPTLPAWLHAPAPQEARPPRPLSPSAPEDDGSPLPPPGPAMRAAARRGKLLHALFERLPAVSPSARPEAAVTWLTGAGGIADRAEADALAADACRIIAMPALAPLFGPESLAEAPITAVLADGAVVAGTVDRLLVDDDRVLVVDFKTGHAVPVDAASAPRDHLRQMSAYVEALRVIFPERPVEAALLYTAGPRLLSLDAAVLAAHKPGLAATQQKRVLDG